MSSVVDSVVFGNGPTSKLLHFLQGLCSQTREKVQSLGGMMVLSDEPGFPDRLASKLAVRLKMKTGEPASFELAARLLLAQ